MSRKNKLKKYLRKSDSYNRNFFHLAILWHTQAFWDFDNLDLEPNYYATQDYRMKQTCFWMDKYLKYKRRLR